MAWTNNNLGRKYVRASVTHVRVSLPEAVLQNLVNTIHKQLKEAETMY